MPQVKKYPRLIFIGQTSVKTQVVWEELGRGKTLIKTYNIYTNNKILNKVQEYCMYFLNKNNYIKSPLGYMYNVHIKHKCGPGVVTPIFNPRIWEAEASGPL